MSEEIFQLAAVICEKQSPKENLKTETMSVFFCTKHADGLLFLVTTFMMKKEKKYLPFFIVFKHLLLK